MFHGPVIQARRQVLSRVGVGRIELQARFEQRQPGFKAPGPQLLDAVAVGQFTPGPVFTTATFVGYLVGSWPGAIVATIAIFLPSFVLVALVYPFVRRLRDSPWTSAFLDGANAAAIGLMAAVAWQLGTTSIVDPLTAALAAGSAALLIRWRVNSAWLVLGGGGVGLLASALR